MDCTKRPSDAELRDSVKAHYEQISNESGHFSSIIPVAIDFYFEHNSDLILNNPQIEAINEFIGRVHSSVKKLQAVEVLDYEDKNWLFGDQKIVSERKQAELKYCENMINQIKKAFDNEVQELRNISI